LRAAPAVFQLKVRVALAHYERSTRYDLARIETTAQPDGSGYMLRGVKSVVPDGPSADKLIVSARLDEGGASGLFLVDTQLPGVEVYGYRLLDDTRAADVVLNGVRVDESALLLGPDRSLQILEEAIDRLILARVAESLGAMETVLEISNEYVKARAQYGQPLAKFQATQHRLAEMFVEVQETRSVLYCGLAHIDAGVAEETGVCAPHVTDTGWPKRAGRSHSKSLPAPEPARATRSI